MMCPLWSSSTSPTRSTYLPICTRATSGRAARSNTTALNELKADAGAISLESVLAETAKLENLRSLGLSADVFCDVSLKVVAVTGRATCQANAAAVTQLWACRGGAATAVLAGDRRHL